jgi:hypothetical protein
LWLYQLILMSRPPAGVHARLVFLVAAVTLVEGLPQAIIAFR